MSDVGLRLRKHHRRLSFIGVGSFFITLTLLLTLLLPAIDPRYSILNFYQQRKEPLEPLSGIPRFTDWVNNSVDSNLADNDSSADKGTETNFANCQEESRDGDVMTIVETDTGLPAVNEHLYHTGTCTNASTGWTYVGPDPALSTTSGGYISTVTTTHLRQWFNLDNTASRGDGLTVALSIYVNRSDANDILNWSIDTSGDNTYEYAGQFAPAGVTKWFTISLPSITTGAVVNASRVGLKYTKSGTAARMVVNAVQLNVTRTAASNYQIDFEYNWTTVVYTRTTENVSIYFVAHTGGTETLNLNFWNTSGVDHWTNIGQNTATGWFNRTATNLNNATYTIRFVGATEAGDSTEDTWTIDCIFLSCHNTTRGSWQTLQTLSGTILNNTAFQTRQTINGQIANTTSFKTLQTINGQIANATYFRTIQTISGQLQNITSWVTLQTIGGQIANTTTFKTIQTIDGQIANMTSFKTIQTIDGEIRNNTFWRTIQTVSGLLKNISAEFSTNITITGLSPTYNTTWSKNITGLGGSNLNTFINSSSFQPINRNETMIIQVTVNATSWVKNITFWATQMEDVINGTHIDCDNITVLVSIDNITWGILQDEAGSGMGRYPKITGSLVWNWTTSPPGINPFTYAAGGFYIQSNTTVYSRMMINITPTSVVGWYDNHSGTDWQISLMNDTLGNPWAVWHYTSRLYLWTSAVDVWHSIQIISGAMTNLTSYQTLQTVNGQLVNLTSFKTSQTVNGQMTNLTVFRTLQTINGILRHLPVWQTNQTISGQIINTSVVSDVIIYDNTYFSVKSETITIAMDTFHRFSQVVVYPTYVCLNSSDWNITCNKSMAVRLIKQNTSTSSGSTGDIIISFNATVTAPAWAWFNISGMKPLQLYTITKDAVTLMTLSSSVSGVLSFNNTVWSGHEFNIVYGAALGGTNIPVGGGRSYTVWFLVGIFAGVLVSMFIRFKRKNNHEPRE